MSRSNYLYKRYLVLNMIQKFGSISRTELVAFTDYRPATIGEIVRDLLNENLIIESGSSSSKHGRRRMMLEINSDQICAIGISIMPNSFSIVVEQIDGVILSEVEECYNPRNPKSILEEQIVVRVGFLLTEFIDRNIVGIGIGDPFFDPTGYRQEGSLAFNYEHYNDWIHNSLKPKLENIAGLSVETFSAVTLPALAEMRFGVAKKINDFICVTLGNGIGASICVGGNVISGSQGVAGELGHIVIDASNANKQFCYCGKQGCIEVGTTLPALIREIQYGLSRGEFSSLNFISTDPANITVQDVQLALKGNDLMLRYYVSDAAKRIGIAIANAVNLLNPELVVLYGTMLDLGDFFIEHMSNAIRENTLVLAKKFEIKISDMHKTIIPQGAAAEMFSIYMRSYNYNWINHINMN